MAFQRRKRDNTARRIPKAALVAAPIALLATVSTVTLGIIASDADTSDSVAAQSSLSEITIDRADVVVSRSNSRRAASAEARQTRKELKERQARRAREAARQAREDARQARAATQRAINAADTRLWTTGTLNLWTTALASADQTGLIDDGKKVLVTGREAAGRDEIVIGGEARWVTDGYLSAEKPAPPAAAAPASRASAAPAAPAAAASCTNGSSVSSGVSPNVVEVHEAVCAAFPEITSYGTFRSDGEHAQGLAVDIMVSGARGYEVAEFVRAHASELGVSYAIYSQRIWSTDRGGEGWRSMSDRGSSTANHYDHVHVTTY